MSINTCSISGNLTKDVELRSTQGGAAVATFTVAVNDRKKDHRSGECIDVPNYIPCVMFGKRAELIGNYISKGSKVSVLGKLRWSQWQDKQTQKNRSKIEVIVDEVEFMSRKGDSQGQNQPQQQQMNNYPNQYQNAANTAPQQPTGYQPDLADEPIPF